MGGGRTNSLASVASVSDEIKGVRFTCTAPIWPPLHIYKYIYTHTHIYIYIYIYIYIAVYLATKNCLHFLIVCK